MTSELVERALRLAPREGLHTTPLAALQIIRTDRANARLHVLHRPSLCFLVQGAKVVTVGTTTFRYTAEEFLFSSVELPATGEVIEASPRRPYLCLVLPVDPGLVFDLEQRPDGFGTGLATIPGMKPYGLDLRSRIVEAYDRKEGSIRELASRFKVAPNTVENYLKRRRLTGAVTPAPHGGGPARLVRKPHERVLRALVRASNDRTDAEYAVQLAARTGLRVSRRTINRTWHRLKVTRKKKVLHASEQGTPEGRRARRAFRQRARRRRPRRHFFVDEFGTNLAMTRRYARAPRPARAVGKVPENADPNVTLTMALSRDGIVAPWAFERGTDGEAFVTYLRDQLAPHLRPGDVVLADNLGAHRALGARAAVEARGATYDLLPPYSPDYSPVEEAGAKVKAAIRAENPRTVAALLDAMGHAIGSVTADDAQGWFSHRANYLERRTKRVRPPL